MTKRNVKVVVKGLAVVAVVSAVSTAGVFMFRAQGDSKTVNATQTPVAVSTTVDKTEAKAPATEVAAVVTPASEVETKAEVKTEVKAEVKAEVKVTNSSKVTADTFDINAKSKSESFKDEPTDTVMPQIDVRLVSNDGKIDTWTSVNDNGDLYNAKGERFKGNGDGTYRDANGVNYKVAQVYNVPAK